MLQASPKIVYGISAQHPFYAAWYNMRQRCYNTNHKQFHHYGGRGITVSAQWEDFKYFQRDLWPTWKPGLELERRDNEQGYHSENCVWADRKTQMRNTRSTKLTAEVVAEIRQLKGQLSQKELGLRFGVNKSHISRIQNNLKWAS